MRLVKTSLIVSIVVAGLYFLQKAINHKSIQKSEQLKGLVLRSRYNHHPNNPDISLIPPSDLQEISGLSPAGIDSVLLSVQDEKGIIFYLHKADGRILKSEKFSGKGDYEGIEMVGDDIFVVSSKGDIYLCDSSGETKTYETFLNTDYDVEGLAYYSAEQVLLLACKANGKDNDKNIRSIFSFDLSTRELNRKPFLQLDGKEIARQLGRVRDTPYFSPSAICSDQHSDLYLISSVASALIVINRQGDIKSAVELDPTLHRQPEGIMIDDNGVLYIANEGRDGVPKVYIFNPK